MKKHLNQPLGLLFALSAFISGCGSGTSSATSVAGVVYLNFNSHNEESTSTDPDYTSALNFTTYRAYVKQIADTIYTKGAKWNFGSDWRFIKGAQLYDTGSDTNGKNIFRYMSEDKGIEIDPHAHETTYNYPDVAYLLTQVGLSAATITTVNGFIYDTTAWQTTATGKSGVQTPTYSWTPSILWGGASSNHTSDDQSYGIWRPKSATDFNTDDSTKNYIYIGAGCTNLISSSSTASDIVAKITKITMGSRAVLTIKQDSILLVS